MSLRYIGLMVVPGPMKADAGSGRATWLAASAQARRLAVSHYDWWNMYEEIDRRLKNLVALKQSGQPRPEGV